MAHKNLRIPLLLDFSIYRGINSLDMFHGGGSYSADSNELKWSQASFIFIAIFSTEILIFSFTYNDRP